MAGDLLSHKESATRPCAQWEPDDRRSGRIATTANDTQHDHRDPPCISACVWQVATLGKGGRSADQVTGRLRQLRRLVGRPLQRYPNRGTCCLLWENIILRRFTSPFGGTAEVVGYCSAIDGFGVGVFAEAESAHRNRHHYWLLQSESTRSCSGDWLPFWGTVIFSMAAWQIFARGKMDEWCCPDTLQIAYYLAICSGRCCVVFFAIRVFIDGLLKFQEAGKKWRT